MKIELTPKEKNRTILVLAIALCISVLHNLSDIPEDEPDRFLHYGIVDENVNYEVIYDQETDEKATIPTDVFGDEDTIYVSGHAYIRLGTKLKNDKKSTICLEKSN